MCSSAHRACGETRWGPASALQHIIREQERKEAVIRGKKCNKVNQNYTALKKKRTDTHGPGLQLNLPVGWFTFFCVHAMKSPERQVFSVTHVAAGEKSKIPYSKQDYASNTSNGAHRTNGWWLQKGQSSWPWCCPSRPWAPTPAGGAT